MIPLHMAGVKLQNTQLSYAKVFQLCYFFLDQAGLRKLKYSPLLNVFEIPRPERSWKNQV